MDDLDSILSELGINEKAGDAPSPTPSPPTAAEAPALPSGPPPPITPVSSANVVRGRSFSVAVGMGDYETIRDQMSQLPTWALKKLRDEILKRKQIEDRWESEFKKIELHREDLRQWKQTVLKLQNAATSEAASLKELLLQKDKEVKRLQLELKEKDIQIQKLTVGHQLSDKNLQSSPAASPVIGVAVKKRQLPASTSQAELGGGSPLPFNQKLASYLGAQTKTDAFVDLLFQPDMLLVSILAEISVGKVQDDIAKSIVPLFESRGQTIKLMEFIISKEVEKTKSETTLFRTNSFASRAMTYYTMTFYQNYLTDTVKPLLQEIIDKNESYEIDPIKARPEDDTEQNLQKLSAITQRILDAILNSLDQCPTPFRQICAVLMEEISKKYSESGWLSGVVNFFFLRYWCPVLLSPPPFFGFGEISETSRRTLILISKIIQNTVNGVEFKEAYMKSLNTFLADNSDRVKEFLKNLSQVPPGANKHLTSSSSAVNLKECAKTLMSCVISIKDQVLEKLHAHDSQLYTQTLMYRTSDRLASVVAGPSQKSRRGSTINDTRTEDLATTLIEEEALSMELVDLFCSPTASDKDRDKVNHALALALSSTKGAKTFVSLESRLLLKDLNFFKLTSESASIKLFASHCQLTCVDFAKTVVLPFADEVPEDLKAHSEPLMDYTGRVLNSFFKTLSLASPSVHQTCNLVHQQMQAVSTTPRTAGRAVLKSLILGLFCSVLENPELFGVELGKKKAKKSLQLVGDALRHVASANDADEMTASAIKDIKYKDFLLRKSDAACDSVEQWLAQQDQRPFTYNPDINALDSAMLVLYDKIYDKLEVLTNKLANSSANLTVNFKASDFFKQLMNSTSVGAAPPPSPGSRINTKSSIF